MKRGEMKAKSIEKKAKDVIRITLTETKDGFDINTTPTETPAKAHYVMQQPNTAELLQQGRKVTKSVYIYTTKNMVETPPVIGEIWKILGIEYTVMVSDGVPLEDPQYNKAVGYFEQEN